MKEPRWISVKEALTIQEMQIAETGGRAGIRDANLLESALARPINRFLYSLPKVTPTPELAAVYAWGLVRNHPFVDGNKRIGLVLSAVFLEKNGFQLEASQVDAYQTFMDLAEGSITERTLKNWFLAKSRPMKRRPARALSEE